jgi:hypothetical protein
VLLLLLLRRDETVFLWNSSSNRSLVHLPDIWLLLDVIQMKLYVNNLGRFLKSESKFGPKGSNKRSEKTAYCGTS